MYKQAINANIQKKESIKSLIKSISLDLLEEGFGDKPDTGSDLGAAFKKAISLDQLEEDFDDTTNLTYQRLDELRKHFSTKKQETNLKTLETVMQKLKIAVNNVFE